MSGGEKIGFLGGSFDPVHLGHLIMAQDACENAGLDRVYFVPAAANPHKDDQPALPAEMRIDLLKASIRGDERFGLIDWEVRQPPPSYTWKTVKHLKAEFPADRLFWIIGSDQLPSLGQWAEPETLFSIIEFIVLERPGYRTDVSPVPEARLHFHPMHVIDISSTLIRSRLREGKRVDFFLPSPVLEKLDQLKDFIS